MATHSLDFWLTSEDLPDPENRVTINNAGEIVLSYTPNNLEAHKRLKHQLSKMMKNSSCDLHGSGCHQGLFDRSLFVGQQIPLAGVAHQNGTVRFGPDPLTSALDVNCKAHDLDNLYVVDGSFFPSSGAVNPALTIVANTLRVGDHSWSACMRITTRRRRCRHEASDPSMGCLCGCADHLTVRGRSPACHPRRLSRNFCGFALTGPSPFTPGRSNSPWRRQTTHPAWRGWRLALPPGIQARTSRLVLGEECLDLTEYRSPRGAPFPQDSRANDGWFEHIAIVVTDMDKAYARVRGSGTRFVSNVPQTLPVSNKEAAGIMAFYFRDPDGHYLELIHFPPGKGQAKWQVPSSKLFLGIDHTAIAVADMRRSVDFYRGVLHFNMIGSSENYGTEQEHLSGVFNAHVLITSLRATSGIGIELLDYVSPASALPIPAGLRVEDVACWQIPLDMTSSSPLQDIPRSPDDVHWVQLPAGSPARKAAWIKDPDGHLLELMKQ